MPDYDSPLKSLSDTSCDSLNFGLAFVTDEVYTTLQKEGKSAKSEEYYYAYKLNDAMTDDELKAELKKLSFSSDDVDDVYFRSIGTGRSAGKRNFAMELMSLLTVQRSLLKDFLS